MHVAWPKRASFQVSELVEHEERMVTGTLEVSVPRAPLLIAMRWADAGIHIQHDALARTVPGDLVDPMTREIGERCEVFSPYQPVRFEPSHLAWGRARSFGCFATDDPAHGGVVT